MQRRITDGARLKFSIPERSLGLSDVEFKVWKDDEMLETLKISKGSLVWFPRNTLIGYRVNWTKFDAFMQQQRDGERR
jgi:hypothetical protein